MNDKDAGAIDGDGGFGLETRGSHETNPFQNNPDEPDVNPSVEIAEPDLPSLWPPEGFKIATETEADYKDRSLSLCIQQVEQWREYGLYWSGQAKSQGTFDKDQIERFQRQVNDLVQANQVLEQTVEQVGKDNAVLVADTMYNERRIAELETTVQEQRDELREQDRRIIDFSDTNSRLTLQVIAAEKKPAGAETSDNEAFWRSISDLQDQYDKAAIKMVTHDTRMRGLENRVDRLLKEAESLKVATEDYEPNAMKKAVDKRKRDLFDEEIHNRILNAASTGNQAAIETLARKAEKAAEEQEDYNPANWYWHRLERTPVYVHKFQTNVGRAPSALVSQVNLDEGTAKTSWIEVEGGNLESIMATMEFQL